MKKQLYIAVVLRLLSAWLLLSVLLGSATFWLESTRVDNFVFDLASSAAAHFTQATSAEVFNGQAEKHRDNIQDALHQSQFVAIRLYAENHSLLLEAWKTQEPILRSTLTAHSHTFPDQTERHFNKVQVGDELYIQVLIPLVSAEQKTLGYFEGVYQLAAPTREAISHRVRDALLLVLLIVSVTSMALYPVIVSLNKDSVRLSLALLDSNIELMQTLGSAIAKRDSDTDAHNYRVTLYAIKLAEALKLTHQEIATLIAGAFLHDVGKIGIPDSILLKPSKLDVAEIAIMKTHVSLGEDIIRESQWLTQARDVVAFHHEKFDGTGYLRGLTGTEIPLNARLFAIVDVFDALASKRPYKDAKPIADVLAILKEGRGTHFDPVILDVFLGIAVDLHHQHSAADSECLRKCLIRSIHTYF